jgi:hypothetical protein
MMDGQQSGATPLEEEQTLKAATPVTRWKDPRKVEAGRRGAAAQMAKMKERLLAEMGREKGRVAVEDAPTTTRGSAVLKADAAAAPRHQDDPYRFLPWLVAGGLVIAATGYVLSGSLLQAPPQQRHEDPGSLAKPNTLHLNIRDPFHM